jgi:hypothetical protein
MNTDIYILSAKAMFSEDLTDDEKKTLHDYNTKYKLVRYLVMEHRKLQGFELVDFQFTPGDTFLKTSALDVANAIIESFSGPTTPLDFGDLRWKDNPPHTGKTKIKLGE